MPDDLPGRRRIVLELPADLVDAFERLATLLDRPRAWVIERALCCWLDDEGAEILEDTESLAELDRGETAPFEDTLRKVREIIERAEARRARAK
jgi:predicted transcriptional regulator